MNRTEKTQMESQPAILQARRAIEHALRRIREHAGIGYYMGEATQAFELLTEAYATITGARVADVRRDYQPTSPADPGEVRMPLDPVMLVPALSFETRQRIEQIADRGDLDMRSADDLVYLVEHLLDLGLRAKEAELDDQTAELF